MQLTYSLNEHHSAGLLYGFLGGVSPPKQKPRLQSESELGCNHAAMRLREDYKSAISTLNDGDNITVCSV